MGEDAGKSINVVIKPWYASRLYWLGIVTALYGVTRIVLQLDLDPTEGQTYIDWGEGIADAINMVIGLVIMQLRKRTTQPIG